MEIEAVPIRSIQIWEALHGLIPYTDDDLAFLRSDLKKRGQQLPLVIDQKYRLLDGHRRLAVLDELGVDHAVCIIKTFTNDNEALEFAIRNKLSCQCLHPIDRVRLEVKLRESLSIVRSDRKRVDIDRYIPDRLIDLLKRNKIKESFLHKMVFEMKSMESKVGNRGIEHIKQLLNTTEAPWLHLSTIRQFFKNPDVDDETKQRAIEGKWTVHQMSTVSWGMIEQKQKHEQEEAERSHASARELFETKYGRIPEGIPDGYQSWAENRLRQFTDSWGITRNRALTLSDPEMDFLISQRLEKEILAHRESIDRRKAEFEKRLRNLTSNIEQLSKKHPRPSAPEPSITKDWENLSESLLTPLERKWRQRQTELEVQKTQIDRESGLLDLKFKAEALNKELNERLILIKRREATRKNPEEDIRIELLGLLPNNWESMPEKDWKHFQRAFRLVLHPDRRGKDFTHTSSVVNALLDYANQKRSFKISP
ncbi:MAG: ParB N-terminal domain-containing protein [Deltaproteobacteria bacterium]|nr:ParB N-terminal domain-containing protein [Deltaproteobacteria bacterium]